MTSFLSSGLVACMQLCGALKAINWNQQKALLKELFQRNGKGAESHLLLFATFLQCFELAMCCFQQINTCAGMLFQIWRKFDVQMLYNYNGCETFEPDYTLICLLLLHLKRNYLRFNLQPLLPSQHQ